MRRRRNREIPALDKKSHWYGTDDDRVTYDESHSIEHACPDCGRDMGFDPNDPDS